MEDAHPRLRMLVVHDRLGDGFFVAMVPADLSQDEVETALNEFGVEAEETLELSGWRTNGRGVAVAWVPFPEGE